MRDGAATFEPGPMWALCKEVGFRFNFRMETPEMLAAFVRILVECVEDDFRSGEFIKGKIVIGDPDNDSPRVFEATRAMLAAAPDRTQMIAAAEKVHDLCHELNPEETYPTNHTIDMLSSCASAIRFGFEIPCHSRHAASAAGHIWERHYGLRLMDSCTPAWRDDWIRQQLQEAITRERIRLAIAAPRASNAAS